MLRAPIKFLTPGELATLTREELVALASRYIRFVSPYDLAFARWEVANAKVLELGRQAVVASKTVLALGRDYDVAPTANRKAKAWSKYLRARADQDRLEARLRRAEKTADRLYVVVEGLSHG